MNKERLQLTADHLETIPEDKFDLGTWFNEIKDEGSLPVTLRVDCGTVFCVIGWAASTCKPLMDQGLSLAPSSDKCMDSAPCPHYNGKESWDAVEAFYDLTKDQAEYLFYSSSYEDESKDKVLERLRGFIEHGVLYYDDNVPGI